MKTHRVILSAALTLLAAFPAAGEDWIPRLSEKLSLSSGDGRFRVRISGLADLEGYLLEQPTPGLIFTDRTSLVNPRLTLFLDAQLGANVYLFAQGRMDRGFDPERRQVDVRLDEFAARISPWKDGRFSVQVGRFGTVVGNWVQRHSSWDSPFINAPVPYDNLTGIWDISAPDSPATFLNWGHVGPGYFAPDGYGDKYLRNPVVWGPSYASGISVAGRFGKFEYAAEMKNSPLASRPESWDVNEVGFEHPTLSARIGYRPNQAWRFGFSASSGAYLLPEAEPSLPPGRDRGDYKQMILAQDVSFEWHHLQVWAEFYQARFEVPTVGHADTFAYYIEAKYKFTPQFFGAVRWNQQFFDNVPDGKGGEQPWGNDYWRVDTAIGYRFTPHTQFKLQYSMDHSKAPLEDIGHMLAGQFTVRF